MLYLTHIPAPPLDKLVEHLWLLSDAPAHVRELIMPSGTIELAINLHDDDIRIYDPCRPNECRRFSGMVFSGAYGGPFGVDTAAHSLMMGVHFKPGGAFPFLRVDAGELSDAHVDAEVLWGRHHSARLREQLCSAANHAERFVILENALRAMRVVEGRSVVRFAVERLMNGGVTVRDLVSELGLSHRRFVEVFTREVGMTPKLFFRVRRFQRIVSAVRSTQNPAWTQLGTAAGYFDQPHLIRDFTAFCGMPPGRYLRSRIDVTKENHVALT